MNERFRRIVNAQLAKAKPRMTTEYFGSLVAAGVKVPVYKVLSVIHSSNFQKDLGTRTFVTLMIPTTHYRLIMTQAHGDLSFKLLTKVADKNLRSIDYCGIVCVNKDVDMETPTMFQNGTSNVNVGVIHLELMEKTLWNVRTRPVGNIYRQIDALSVCRAILADTLPTQQGEAGEAAVVNYEEFFEDNMIPKRYGSIVIPERITFLQVFDFLQKSYGVYPDGLGVFLYLNRWFMFRLYNDLKYKEAGQFKLNIYALPKEQGAHLEKTYVNAGNIRHIFVSGDTQAYDFQDASALNNATGYRVGSVRALDSRSVSMAGGEEQFTTPEAYVSSANPIKHKSGVQNAPVLAKHYVDDDKEIRSGLKQSAGQIVKLTWTQSVLGVLYPGMPVKFMYSNDRGIYTRYGTVIGEVFQSQLDGGSIASPTHNTVTEISVWLSSEVEENK